jgi:CRISPR-associated protein Cas2
MRNAWLVSYDVSDQGRQREVRKLLLGLGDPLHYSVFMIHATKLEIGHLRCRLEGIIELTQDRILFFNCGKEPEAVLGRFLQLGRPLEKDIFSDMMWIF